MTMKTYYLYVFTQEECPPCKRLKQYIDTLPEPQQKELHIVTMKEPKSRFQPYAEPKRTQLAEKLEVMQTPTLVVVHEELACDIDNNGDEWCDGIEVPVERFVGANDIIEHLPATLNAYTYAIDDD
jgi:glutaredoxin